MRALLPEPQPEVDVHTHYAADWIDRGGLRANMIASVDGAAAAAGLTAGLQTPGDNRVFAALRDLADVVLVGWSTAAAENYRPVRIDDERRARRAAFGLRPRLPVAVLSRQLRIDPGIALLSGADPDSRTLVLTCAAADPGRRAALSAVADVVICGEDDIDYAVVRQQLAGRGLTRLLCEGGPTILERVLHAEELDELCLSVTPLIAGPGATRIVAGATWTGRPRPIRLHSALEEDGAIFLRYTRDLIPAPAPTAD